jgi:Tfp pilus assembly protein PilO
MAFKLQPREQSILGVGFIAAVCIFGLFGVVWDFAILPQWDQFSQIQTQLNAAKTTESANAANLTSLSQEKDILKQSTAEMPEGKEVGKIDTAEGGTMESTKRDLMNTVIEMSQNEYKNVLMSAKPLPKPKPPPQPINPDPNQAGVPEMRLSDFIEELPFEMKLRGNYTSLNDFINELAKYNIVIEISRLEVVPEKETKAALKDPSRPLEAKFMLNFLIQK